MASSPSDVLFAHVACRPDAEIDLAVAALVIAEVESPGLDIATYVATLDAWGDAVRRRAGDAPPDSRRRVEALRAVLFEVLDLRGNHEDYYDPRNSFLDQVMDRRVGIPITLAVIVLEVARRAGVEARGVGFPGHFLVRVSAEGRDLLIDAYDGGAVLGEDDLAARLEVVSPGATLSSEHLPLVDKQHILVRMLNNLRAIYSRSGDERREAGVAARLALLAGTRGRGGVSPPAAGRA